MSAREPVSIRSHTVIPLAEQSRLAGVEAQLQWLLEEAGEMTPAELGLPSEEAKSEILAAGWAWAQSVSAILDHVVSTRRPVS